MNIRMDKKWLKKRLRGKFFRCEENEIDIKELKRLQNLRCYYFRCKKHTRI